MELTSLKDRKYVQNTGKLPGFTNGFASDKFANYNAYQQTVQPNKNTINGGQIFNNDVVVVGRKPTGVSVSGIKPNAWTTQYLQDNQRQLNEFSKTPVTRGEAKNIGSPSSGAAPAAGPWFAVGSWLGGGVLEGLNASRKSADEYLTEAGTSQSNVAGIGYTAQNNVNVGKIMDEYNNEATSAFLTNPGKAITMLFGRDKAEKQARKAQQLAINKNAFERGAAISKSISIQNAKQYGDQDDQILYAKNGKLAKCEDGLVSATGLVNGEANARVSNGEVVANKTLGTMYRVPGIKNNKDGKLASLNNSDTVITNKFGLSDYVWQTGDIEGAEAMMKILGKPKYKCGKLPKLAEGWAGNFIPAAIGTAASLEQMLSAYRNKPYRPNSYSSNPYELEGLTTLAGLRINPYPIINQLRSAEARTNRAVDIAGGLSGGQRSAARLAALNTTQNNISNLLSNIQQQNNAYKSAYAQAALTAGQQSRQARMSANQWDYDMYARAHAARNKGIQTGIANMLSQIQQYQANEFKRRQFNETMDLYRADQKQRNEYNNWMKNTALNINNNADPIKNPGSQYFNQLSPYEKWMILQNRGIIS